jgi:hypothetical protein
MQRHTVGEDRVRSLTWRAANARIDRRADEAVARARAGGEEAIDRRLSRLAREWDVDRAVMAFLSVVGSVAHELSRRPRTRWLRHLTRLQLAFIGVHAVAGWCPPVALFRRLGFRTQKEIQAEREALLQLQP